MSYFTSLVMVWAFGLVIVSYFILEGSPSRVLLRYFLPFSCFPSLVIVLISFTCL